MDSETPSKGNKRLKTCTGRKNDVSFGGTLEDLDPGELSLPTWKLSLEGPGHHHDRPIHHPELRVSSLEAFVSLVACVGISLGL
jgi:hypothetical protein